MKKTVNYALVCLLLVCSNSVLLAQKKPSKKAKTEEITTVPFIAPKYSEVDTIQTDYGKTTILPWQPPVKIEHYKPTSTEQKSINQFIAFCKNQIDIENGSRYSTNYTQLVVEALGGNIYEMNTKSVIKKRIEEIKNDADLRLTFFKYFANLSGGDKTRLYFILRPSDNDTRFVSRISGKDADILSELLLREYFRPVFKSDDDETQTKEDNEVYSVVEKDASFKGGESAYIKYIQQNLILPKSSNSNETENYNLRYRVSFTVTADGSITDVKIDNPKKELKLYEEAIIECFKKMPKWEPAESGGKKVNSRIMKPVTINI
ncbi:energy transducer TonB [Flavobacterium aciduliphilum]|uniref:TonB-like protein n=1 Tax=Flavobacterium aciduliphilum TaxID=1101402 RepID=A0A328Y7X6_9FLAO|nr:energy transducer TonB [Flavobacterium aciduliphilum]RAR70009.1 TonB-like protein [Flavobacterium aciduliphilum]